MIDETNYFSRQAGGRKLSVVDYWNFDPLCNPGTDDRPAAWDQRAEG